MESPIYAPKNSVLSPLSFLDLLHRLTLELTKQPLTISLGAQLLSPRTFTIRVTFIFRGRPPEQNFQDTLCTLYAPTPSRSLANLLANLWPTLFCWRLNLVQRSMSMAVGGWEGGWGCVCDLGLRRRGQSNMMGGLHKKKINVHARWDTGRFTVFPDDF